jgi:hypothetical protein
MRGHLGKRGFLLSVPYLWFIKIFQLCSSIYQVHRMITYAHLVVSFREFTEFL